MKTIPALLLVLLTVTPLLAKEHAATMMPPVSGKDLNGKPWTAPGGLPGDRTIVLLGFDEPQQAPIDEWIHQLGLDAPDNTVPWIEMPLIDNPGMFMRWFIDTEMRGGIPNKETRSHVWTAYTDRKAFMKSCGIASDKKICILVIDHTGRILAMETGNWSRSGSLRVRNAANTPKS